MKKNRGPKSRTRIGDREVINKVIPSIKLLSNYMHNTAPSVPRKDFHGYEVPVGIFTDNHGKQWQFQLRAICTKKKLIKSNEIKPIMRKWAILFRLRLFLKVFIDKLYGDEVVK